jgi:hypothetical protein
MERPHQQRAELLKTVGMSQLLLLPLNRTGFHNPSIKLMIPVARLLEPGAPYFP